jgi:hypothetical protein
VIGIFLGHVALRQAMQLAINEGSQPVERLIVAIAPGTEQRCYAA